MYRVIKFFTDLHDNDHSYNVGNIFPREGVEATEGRFAELAGSYNKQGVPLIEEVEDSEEEITETEELAKEEGAEEEPEPEEATLEEKEKPVEAPEKKPTTRRRTTGSN